MRDESGSPGQRVATRHLGHEVGSIGTELNPLHLQAHRLEGSGICSIDVSHRPDHEKIPKKD